MPKNLRRSLDQLAFLQVKHKASGVESLNCFKCVLQHLLLSVPVHGYVIQVDNYRQVTVIRPTAYDNLNYELEMYGCLCKPHRHP